MPWKPAGWGAYLYRIKAINPVQLPGRYKTTTANLSTTIDNNSHIKLISMIGEIDNQIGIHFNHYQVKGKLIEPLYRQTTEHSAQTTDS